MKPSQVKYKIRRRYKLDRIRNLNAVEKKLQKRPESKLLNLCVIEFRKQVEELKKGIYPKEFKHIEYDLKRLTGLNLSMIDVLYRKE